MSSVAAPAATWRVIGASVRGTAHARGDLPCQDAHAWRRLPGGAVAIAVADGAGSAVHAEAGARAAAQAAVDSLVSSAPAVHEGVWTAALDHAMGAALGAVNAEAAARRVEPRDLSTTLIACVLTPDSVTIAQVGDGAAIVADADGMRALTAPTSGEFANETVFITSAGAVEAAQRATWRGAARRLALFTDGLQGLALKLPARTPHEPFFVPLFDFAGEAHDPRDAETQLAAFLSGPRVTARSDDDITLVLVARDHA
ncbi:MAG TPA: PP2C family serine/threonine-protein phosphatase [Longimicrobium sp.]|nr:PP2C family serine/threonine-protein phosphatase [Longimicrobium sp.]